MNLNWYTFNNWKRKISPSSSKGRTSKEWEAIIEDWKHSTLSLTEYCRTMGLNFPTFSSWKIKYYPSSAEERHILAQKKWENIIEGWKNSGLSSKEYCRQMDLKVSTFYNWKIKIYPTKNEERLLPTKKKWKGIIEDWQRSDLNQNEYCRRKGFKPSTFANWKRKLYPSSTYFSDKRPDLKKKWKAIVEDWSASGLSKNEYCNKKKIKYPTFNCWIRKFYPFATEREDLKEKWKDIIEDWKQSGLSREEYCQKKEITFSSFRRWTRKIYPASQRKLDIKKKWEAIIEDWKRSGLSQNEYCREKEITHSAFSRWKGALCPSSAKKHTLEEWEAIIEDWKQSSLSREEYCQKKEISFSSFRHWIPKIYPASQRKLDIKKTWEAIIEDWKQSGLSQNEYCREKEITHSAFCRWKKRLLLLRT
ncbi:MAG: hypothetical protein A2Z80_00250 [Alphaproteobacteria bacterium GWA2_41_27]|nr:MAG: hypothetical protein A2Z80_00250 [Alphaproteobacteria bacterium GWA2_41_27]